MLYEIFNAKILLIIYMSTAVSHIKIIFFFVYFLFQFYYVLTVKYGFGHFIFKITSKCIDENIDMYYIYIMYYYKHRVDRKNYYD